MSKTVDPRTSNNPISSKLLDGNYEPLQDRIRTRAYELYQERGAMDGHDVEDWVQAEEEVHRQEHLHRAA